MEAEEGSEKADSRIDKGWQVLASGKMADVAVEKALYKNDANDRFYLRIRVTNKSKAEIGLAADYWNSIHPNQWGVHSTKERILIDEGRDDPALGLKKAKSDAFDSFLDGNLAPIPAGKSVTYLREFNGPAGRSKIDGQREGRKHFIVSMDGRLLCADGETVESFDCEWTDKKGPAITDVVFKFPLQWKDIPEDETVLEDD